MNTFEFTPDRRGHGRRHGGGRGNRRGPRPMGFGPEFPGPGGDVPGFGGGPGFGPGGFGGPGFGRRRGPGRGPGRAMRGDVRAAVLLLLSEEPMHGYQLMQTIADRTDGVWTPSPGAIYPTINQLEDEGLVSVSADGGRKLVSLTEAGATHVAENKATWPNPFPAAGGADGVNLRDLVHQVGDATRQVGRSGSDAQRAAAAEILSQARRSLYLLLADGAPEAPAEGDGSPSAE